MGPDRTAPRPVVVEQLLSPDASRLADHDLYGLRKFDVATGAVLGQVPFDDVQRTSDAVGFRPSDSCCYVVQLLLRRHRTQAADPDA